MAKKKLQKAKSQCLKEKVQIRYSEIDREVKKKARADKTAFTETLADGAEEAAQKQDMPTLYKITKSIAGGFKNNYVPVKDTDGNVITDIAEQMQRWKTISRQTTQHTCQHPRKCQSSGS